MRCIPSERMHPCLERRPLITATNRDLRAQIEAETFRQDLYATG